MKNLGVRRDGDSFSFPQYREQFALTSSESDELNETLRGNPVSLSWRLEGSGEVAEGIPDGLVPGDIAGGVLENFDFGRLVWFYRDSENVWNVQFRTDPRDGLDIYSTFEFVFSRSDEANVLAVYPVMSVNWRNPDFCDDKFSRTAVVDFYRLMLEMKRMDREEGAYSLAARLDGGINFAPVSFGKSLGESIERVTDVLKASDIRRLTAINNYMVNELRRAPCHGMEEKNVRDGLSRARDEMYSVEQRRLLERVKSEAREAVPA